MKQKTRRINILTASLIMACSCTQVKETSDKIRLVRYNDETYKVAKYENSCPRTRIIVCSQEYDPKVSPYMPRVVGYDAWEGEGKGDGRCDDIRICDAPKGDPIEKIAGVRQLEEISRGYDEAEEIGICSEY